MKKAFFRFAASPIIGAGHAVRSCVLADALIEEGWDCTIVTLKDSIDFIENLKKYKRIDPEDFYKLCPKADLLVVDNYDLDESYETHFRKKIQKILVIDDLANRKHDCDILLDQTYGRDSNDYKHLVPNACKILAGSDYVLLRKEFIEMRPRALQKRRETKKVERILISMGGSDPKNYTLKALELVKENGFKGTIDIVLGFNEANLQVIQDFVAILPNACTIHNNANMPQLIYEADLAIGAAGSSVWERCCLGLPQVVLQTALNQSKILDLLPYHKGENFLNNNVIRNRQKNFFLYMDGFGVRRLLQSIQGFHDSNHNLITLKKIKHKDMDWVYTCQQTPQLREFSFNKKTPSYEDHKLWFKKKLEDHLCIFEKILCNNELCGTLRLDYDPIKNYYVLSWYVLPNFQNKGIGTIAVKLAKYLVDKKIVAFAFNDNIPSHKALEKSGFLLRSQEENGVCYEC